jgi:hypothetical protein
MEMGFLKWVTQGIARVFGRDFEGGQIDLQTFMTKRGLYFTGQETPGDIC